MTYVEQIERHPRRRFEFAPVWRKNLRRRANILKWVDAMDGEGLPIDLPEILLEEAFRTHYSELTIGQFVDVTNGIDQIVHLARLKNRLLKNKQQRDLAELTTTLVASVEDHVKRKVAAPRADRRPKETRHRLWGDFFASQRKLASLLRELDGWTDGGPMWEAIMRPLNEAGGGATEMQAAAAQQMHALVERAFPGRAKTRLYQEPLRHRDWPQPLADGADHGGVQLGERGQPLLCSPREQVDRCPGAGDPRHPLGAPSSSSSRA